MGDQEPPAGTDLGLRTAEPEAPPAPDPGVHEGSAGDSFELTEHWSAIRDPDWLPGWWWRVPRRRWRAWAVIGFFALCMLLSLLSTVLSHTEGH
jgi:hypothetical protein